METTLRSRVLHAYKTEAEWTSLDPVLKSGEMAFSSDKYGYYKLGNGTSKWSQLPYVIASDNDFTDDDKEKLGELNTYYGTCETAQATAAKTVSAVTGVNSNFKLTTGATIRVKFTAANTAASPTLNVCGTGAKNIKKVGTTASMEYMWQAGEVVEFVYDGTNYVMTKGGLGTTTYYGLVKLSSSTSSTSTSLAATPSAVKSAYDLANTANSGLSGKVDKVDGKKLSSNDFTDALLSKLNGIDEGANKYVLPVAGTAIGGVKSGTDITVDSSGNVSVNDDSHNHIIGNVDGLQDALDAKVDAVDGKGLSTNDFTTALMNKLSGIAEGAEVNQNAFATVKVGTTSLTADAKSDTLTITAGSNITLTPTASSDSFTIAAKDTTYTPASETPKNVGTAAVGTSAKYAREDHVHGIALATGDSNGQVKIAGTNVSVKGLGSAAYTESSDYAASGHNHDSIYLKTGGVGTAIPSNAELDDYQTPGTYHSPNSTTSKTLKHTPVTGSGFIMYVTCGYITSRVVQTVIDNTNNMFRRYFNGSSWTAWAQVYDTVNKPSKSDIGLGNVENKSSATIRGELTKANVTDALDYTPAELDSNGFVLSSQLPSYVDDVIEGYLNGGKFYKEATHTNEITGESSKIYVDLSTNKTYRWSGSAFTEISASLALGETSSTAYRGDRGKTAYNHSQKTSGNPHKVTKADVGLGNVDNTSDLDKPISTATQAALESHNHDSTYLKLTGGTLTGDLKVGSSSTTTLPDAGITIHDLRSVEDTPAWGDHTANFYFTQSRSPDTGKWWSVFRMRGWTGAYSSWEIAGPSHNIDQSTYPLYVRTSNKNTAWGSWRKIYDTSNKPTASDVGALSTSGGEVTGTLVLSKNTDLSGTANNSPALIVGGKATEAHIEIDANEIHAKSNGTTQAGLNLNLDGGGIAMGKVGTANNIYGTTTFITTAQPIIDLTNNGNATNGTVYNVLGARYKNSAGVTETTYPVRYIGEGDSNGYNPSILLGSTSGTTVIGAGESSGTMPAKITAYNDESIYLIADGMIHGYVNCANDGASYTRAFQISSGYSTLFNTLVLGKNPIRYDGSNNTRLFVLPLISYSTLNVQASQDEQYMQALLKWICTNYPNVSDGTWLGLVSPGSKGYASIHIYDTSKVDSSTGLPEYSDFTYTPWGGSGGQASWVGGTGSYAFYMYKQLNAHNYSSYAVPLTGGTMSGNLSVKRDNNSPDIRVDYTGTKAHSLSLVVSTTNGTGGLYDNTKSKWIVSSDENGNVSLNGNANTATKLASAVEIDGVSFDGSADITHYGTCTTAAATKAKVAACAGFKLVTGARVHVKFTNAQTYNGQVTLNVNSTGAKNVCQKGTTASVRYEWQAGEVVGFVYDGANWLIENGAIATTTYYGKTKLSPSLTSTSTALAATPSTINALRSIVNDLPVYSASTYEVGDRVIYNTDAFECNTAITTAEAWTEAHWTKLSPLQTQIDNITNGTTSGTFTGLFNGRIYSTKDDTQSAISGPIPTWSHAGSANSLYEYVYHNDGLYYHYRNGKDSSSKGYSILQLGNATNSSTVGGTQGYLRIYGEGTTFSQLTARNPSSSINVYLPAIDGELLSLNGTQTVTGAKTFSGNNTFTGQNFIRNTQWIVEGSVTKGTNPSANCYKELLVLDSSADTTWNATTHKRLAGLGFVTYGTSGNTMVQLVAYKNSATEGSSAALSVTYDKANNVAYANAPTYTGLTDSSTKIVTTAYLRSIFKTGTAAATTSNCPNGCFYFQYS